MLQSERPAAISAMAVILAALATLVACRERDTLGGSTRLDASAGELADACASDSLRPASAAPAHGLWLYEQSSSSGERGPTRRVAAMIGPPRSDERALVVTRSVESIEVSASGDTLRHRADAVTVSLELLPTSGPNTLGGRDLADSTVSAHPAATYSVASRVRLAAYEPCATSSRGPRIRYLRLDAAGRIVTDVMLHRASEQ
jgi:hypothetical protein